MRFTQLRALPLNFALGLLVVTTVSTVAGFLSINYSAPVMLFSLLFGMAFNFLSEEERWVDGFQAASTLVTSSCLCSFSG